MYSKISVNCPTDFDPYDGLIIRCDAVITSEIEKGDYDIEESDIANMSFYQVDYEGILEGGERDAFQTFDAISHQLMEIWEIFYKNGHLPIALRKSPWSTSHNMLHLDKLKVERNFRHKGIGKVLIDRVIRSCRGWNIFVVKPYPLQICEHSDEKEYGDLPNNEKVALRKLREYYESIGFTRYGKTEYYYLFINKYIFENPVPIGIEE